MFRVKCFDYSKKELFISLVCATLKSRSIQMKSASKASETRPVRRHHRGRILLSVRFTSGFAFNCLLQRWVRRRIRLMARSYRSVTNCRRSTSSTKQKMKISMWALKNEKFRIVDIFVAESKINLQGDPGTLTFVQFFVVFSSQEQHRSDKSDLVIW